MAQAGMSIGIEERQEAVGELEETEVLQPTIGGAETSADAAVADAAAVSDGAAVGGDVAVDEEDDERKRKKRLLLLLLLLLLALVGAALAIALLDPWGDPRAKPGYYEGKSDDEIRRDLNEQVDWYSMQMSCAPYVVMSPGSTHVPEINIENIEANHCDQKVTVRLKGTGEVLYESKAISPGYHIPDVEFTRAFDAGAYVALVEFQGYERDAHVGGGGQLWGHDEFGSPSQLEMLLIVTDDEQVARNTAAYYLETGNAGEEASPQA